MLISDPGKEDREFGPNGGLQWKGDADEEYIFGTSWLDRLYGGDGEDRMYGFEGDDIIFGDAAVPDDATSPDVLFGDAGNDRLYGYGENSILSGGSGNDYLYN